MQGLRKSAAVASRTFTELLAALDKKRGKGGKQTVRIEHVNVDARAVFGAVQAPQARGEVNQTAGEPHEPNRLAHEKPPVDAIFGPLWGPDEGRDPVPGARNEERKVQNARRRQHRA